MSKLHAVPHLIKAKAVSKHAKVVKRKLKWEQPLWDYGTTALISLISFVIFHTQNWWWQSKSSSYFEPVGECLGFNIVLNNFSLICWWRCPHFHFHIMCLLVTEKISSAALLKQHTEGQYTTPPEPLSWYGQTSRCTFPLWWVPIAKDIQTPSLKVFGVTLIRIDLGSATTGASAVLNELSGPFFLTFFF